MQSKITCTVVISPCLRNELRCNSRKLNVCLHDAKYCKSFGSNEELLMLRYSRFLGRASRRSVRWPAKLLPDKSSLWSFANLLKLCKTLFLKLLLNRVLPVMSKQQFPRLRARKETNGESKARMLSHWFSMLFIFTLTFFSTWKNKIYTHGIDNRVS